MKIRPITPQDESSLWDMLYLAIYVPEGEPRPHPNIIHEPGLSRYVAGWGRAGDAGFAAANQHEIIGAAWYRLLTGENRGYGYVNDDTPELSIALQPAYRGQGIGTELIRWLLDDAAAHFPALSLSVAPNNPAKRLYERFGFVTVGQQGDSLIMLKQFVADNLKGHRGDIENAEGSVSDGLFTLPPCHL